MMNDNECNNPSAASAVDVGEAEVTGCRQQDPVDERLVQKEAEFAQQRAKFMELFRQKEDELRAVRESLVESERERAELQQRVKELTTEVDDIKTAVAIAEVGKEDEVAIAKRQYEEELASFHQIMEESVQQAHQSATAKYEAERIDWIKHQTYLEAEMQDLRAKLSQDREGFLTSLTKTLQKRVALSGQSRDEQDNLEFSMKKAQEDAELLRSVVSPLEEEINSLKEQLRVAREHSRVSERHSPALVTSVDSSDTLGVSVDGKVRELNMSLQTEKASRTDLEMYVAVLNTQKKALVDETDQLRGQLREVCRQLEQEKLDHSSLKRTWQMANDQFLESQRLLMADLCRMESLLTSDQRVQLAEMKSSEVKPDFKGKVESSNSDGQAGHVTESQTDPGETQSSAAELNQSVVAGDTVDASLNSSVKDDSVVQESFSSLLSLTEAQQRALLEPTAEARASQTLVVSALSKAESAPMEGKRLVSDAEWEMLQKEVFEAREKIGRPCLSCANLESQLHSVQDSEKYALSQVRALERQLDLERQALDKQQKYVTELETNLQTVSEQTEGQITTLVSKQRESERFLSGVKQQLALAQRELYDELQRLTENREAVQGELTRLQDENLSLVGKHSKNSQEMQDEAIDLPNTIEDMQLLVLKYREDLITAKVSQEHSEELLKSEIMFLRDQLVAEQQERSTMEENLAQEISHLQQELALRNSLGTELDREKKVRGDAETKMKEFEMSEVQLKQTVTDLQAQLKSLESSKSKYESEIHKLKVKVSSLQTDLENSEAVQRDFVKLSQSLQIQLEKIRASENEVRWQHEDDVDECSNCKQAFTVTRRKHHCRHCGQIFCGECLNKTVNSGPHQRPARVCDVCHTILVPDATPYFCTEPLHTPD